MFYQKGVVLIQKGKIVIIVGFVKLINFIYKIVFVENGDEIFKGQKLKSYALQEIFYNEVIFIFRVLKFGFYYFIIFVQLLIGDIGVKNVFIAFVEYKIIVDFVAFDVVFFFNCFDSNWGLGIFVDQFGLEFFQKDVIIIIVDGKVQMEFKKNRLVYILCKFRKFGMRDEDLERYVFDREQGDSIVVIVNFFVFGEYGLEIYGNDSVKDGDIYIYVCQYFVYFVQFTEQVNVFYQEVFKRRQVLFV